MKTRTSASSPLPSGYSLDPYAYIPAPWFGSGSPGDYFGFFAVVVGDVTGDGRDDIAAYAMDVSVDMPNELLVYAQKPDGTLAAPARYPVDITSEVFLSRADFNEDGVEDVIVQGAQAYTLFASNPQHGLTASTRPIYSQTGLETLVPAVVADVNGDGHFDLVFFMSRQYGAPSTLDNLSRIVVALGDGKGGFSPGFSAQTWGTDGHDSEIPKSMASADLNQDGMPDLAIRVVQGDYGAQIQRQLVRVYYNDGFGRLLPAYDSNATMDTGSTYSSLDYIAIGDLNHDGRNDLVGSPGSNDQRLWILTQSATQRFDQAPLVRLSQPIGVPILVADLDHNGEQDVLVGHDGWNRITYYLQQSKQLGDQQVREYCMSCGDAARLASTSVAIGDINGDGCTDAVVATTWFGLQLLRGSHCSAPWPIAAVCRTKQPRAVPAAGGAPATMAPIPADRRIGTRSAQGGARQR